MILTSFTFLFNIKSISSFALTLLPLNYRKITLWSPKENFYLSKGEHIRCLSGIRSERFRYLGFEHEFAYTPEDFDKSRHLEVNRLDSSKSI